MRENFDPVDWRESQRKRLEELFGAGQMDRQTYLEALGEVDRRFAEMVGAGSVSPFPGSRGCEGPASDG